MLISPVSSFIAREIQPKAARMLQRKRGIILSRSGVFSQLSNLKKPRRSIFEWIVFISKKECDDYIIMQCHPFGVVQSDNVVGYNHLTASRLWNPIFIIQSFHSFGVSNSKSFVANANFTNFEFCGKGNSTKSGDDLTAKKPEFFLTVPAHLPP